MAFILYYPDIILKLQSAKVIYEKVLKHCQTINLFHSWDCCDRNIDTADIIDRITKSRNSLVLYGCTKYNDCPYYLQYAILENTIYKYNKPIEDEFDYYFDLFSYNKDNQIYDLN